jgi:hypothetical protein
MEFVESCSAVSSKPSIAEVQAQFDDWRNSRRKRGRIPNELWIQAIELARIYGISQVSSSLRLNYIRLKERLEKALLPAKQNHDAPLFSFVELQHIPNDRSDNCVIDLKRPDGNCMHIRLQDACSASHLTQLIQTFIG